MKNRLIIAFSMILLGITLESKAQIAINKNTIDGSGILDFTAGTNKGIMLPIVETLPSTAVDGTILMDKNDKKVKMKQNGAWIDMSNAGSISGVSFNPSAEVPNGKVILGSTSSTATGVMVLESTTKALILPKINAPHLNVKSPKPGMICYDTASNTMAIFDGLNWNYWK